MRLGRALVHLGLARVRREHGIERVLVGRALPPHSGTHTRKKQQQQQHTHNNSGIRVQSNLG